LVGSAVASFEASMYIFVVNWCESMFTTDMYVNLPAGQHKIQQPVLFACLLSGFLIGSCMCNVFLSRGYSGNGLAWVIMGVASLSTALSGGILKGLSEHAAPARMVLYLPGTEYDNSTIILILQLLVFFGFFMFELCIGMYFPTLGGVKAALVPEDVRATLYTMFYVPGNLLICVVLCWHFLSGSALSVSTQLFIATGALFFASSCMLSFYFTMRREMAEAEEKERELLEDSASEEEIDEEGDRVALLKNKSTK